MRLTLLFFSITLMIGCGIVWATEATYRVSGIVGQENRWLFAVIEDSAGNCRVYAKGDTLGSWPIVEVSSKGVFVDVAGETRLLILEGSSFIGLGDGNDTVPANSPPPAGSARLVTGNLSQQEMEYAVNNVASELERDKKKTLEPQVLNAILGLPMEARIIAVSDSPVKSTREALNMVRASLSGNRPLDFILSDGDGHTKIYFQPNQPAVPHPHD